MRNNNFSRSSGESFLSDVTRDRGQFSIGLLLQLMWRREEIGVDLIAAIMGLVAVGILVLAGLLYHPGAGSSAR